MTGDAVESIVKHVRTPLVLQPHGGQSHVALPRGDGSYALEAVPLRDPEPQALVLRTLSGLVEYLRSKLDKLTAAETALHVTRHDRVELISHLEGFFRQRLTFVACEAEGPRFPFSRYLGAEEFNVAMQSHFLETPDRAKVLAVVGNIREEQVKQTEDDGTTQTVTARAGVVKVAEVPVPNPVRLKPYRTFVEIDQPESSFVLRLLNGPQAALFEADGGAWKLQAIAGIVDYLKKAELGVSIIA